LADSASRIRIAGTLFAAPGKEGFCERLSCRRRKTAMAKFADPQSVRERGLIE